MTPFGRQLRAFRQDYGLAQGDFAKLISFRQSYISAIERGGKLPKDDKLVNATVAALKMNPSEEAALRQAFLLSQPFEFPPPGTPFFAYAICARVSELIPRLTPSDTEAFTVFLDLLDRKLRPTRAIETDQPENVL